MKRSFPENENGDPDVAHPGSNSTRTGEDLPIISARQLTSDEQARPNAAQQSNAATSDGEINGSGLYEIYFVRLWSASSSYKTCLVALKKKKRKP